MAAATKTKPSTTKTTRKSADASGDSPVGVKELAATLGTTPYVLRGFIRVNNLGGVGRGARYSWTGMEDPAVKKITAEWEAAGETD